MSSEDMSMVCIISARKFALNSLLVCGLVLGTIALQSSLASTAYSQPLQSEGVANDIDRKGRNPHLTVGTVVGKDKVTLLADAFHPSNDYTKYPLQFDFFVNRNFLTSQYRSPTLSGPIGVDVPSSLAKPPFNYVVVVKMLHPNSIYTTVIEGAVFSENLTGTMDCTLTEGKDETDATIYTANSVIVGQSGNSVFNTTFQAKSQSGDRTLTVAAEVTVAANTSDSTGTITTTEDGESDAAVTGGATATRDDSGLSAFTITSEDGNTTLSCAK